MARARQLTSGQKRKIIKAALSLIGEVYVHLPLKKAMHAIDPIQRLKLLDQQSDRIRDREFHNEMLSIFLRLRDLHTSYILPEPLNRTTAFLPFRLDEFIQKGRRKYVVTHTFKRLVNEPSFVPGAIVSHWNGVPIDRAVELNADREAGSNPAARHARGLESLTTRWLGVSLPPDEDWVDITFKKNSRAAPSTTRFTWQVFDESASDLGVGSATGSAKGTCMGLDMRTEVERQVRAKLFRQSYLERRLDILGKVPTLDTKKEYEDVFPRVGDVTTKKHGKVGYIRIVTFDVPNDQEFIDEFIRLVGQLSQNGLIIDVRGNGGGLILAGERLLQCLTPKRIEAEKLHFLNTPTTFEIAKLFEFSAWQSSISQGTVTGAEFSQGFSLLPDDAYNDIGQVYQGPVVLLTDALCYSTTDIFAAGFQDHEIGTILGVADNTGAGGANVWDYGLLRHFVPPPAGPFRAIPRGADFRVAIRRTTRVRNRSGVPLEDLGVQPDEKHDMTLKDVMHGNVDLIEKAAGILEKAPKQTLSIVDLVKKTRQLKFKSSNIERIDIYVNGAPDSSYPGRKTKRSVKLTSKLVRNAINVVELKGYRGRELVASTRNYV